MPHLPGRSHLLALAFLGVVVPLSWGEERPSLQKKALQLMQEGKQDEALQLANKAIADSYLFRGMLYEARGKHTRAVADFTQCIALDPQRAEAYDHRGSELFKLGKVNESVADFDRYIKLQPRAFARHWKRGISLYYVGRYDDGRKQFEGYQTFDANDVENAVWHFLCNVRRLGAEKARAAILPIRKDTRVPMMEVYDLYRGKKKPEAVLKAAQAVNGKTERHRALFYAHLYLGLYYDALGKPKQAFPHMELAANKYRIGHYMGDVARVHHDLLKKKREG